MPPHYACLYCDAEFDPIATRWRCVVCGAKASCCEGEPLPPIVDLTKQKPPTGKGSGVPSEVTAP